jgi:hypothetical protein
MSTLAISVPTMSSIELVEIINAARGDKKHMRHDTFMAKLEKHPAITHQNFLASYKDSTGRTLKCYQLPEREAKLMVMSESLEVQAKVYDRMTALEAAPADPFAHIPAEHRALVVLLCENAAIKAKQEELAHAQAAQQESIQRIEAKQSAVENGAAYFTVIGYGTWRGITFSLTDAAALGRRASTLSKAAGIAVDAVRDPRFGKVNSYHESMLEAALSGLHGGM